MKRIILALLCGLFFSLTYAENRIVLSNKTVQPGGAVVYFDVSVEGSQIYTACYFDIRFPEGLNVHVPSTGVPKVDILNTTEDCLCYTTYYDEDMEMDVEEPTNHTITCSYGEVDERVLRVACVSLNNTPFSRTSGKLCRIYIKATSTAKPGTAELSIENLGLKAEFQAPVYVPNTTANNITIGTSGKASLAVNATNQWSTCILPFATALPEGVKAYECNEQDGENLVLTKAESIEAYTPYLLYAPEGLSATTVTGTIDPAGYPEQGFVSKGYLSGALKSTNIFVGSYVLQNKGDGAKFYPVEFQKTFTMPAGKCWLNDNVASASALRLDTDYVTDGVTTITNEAKNNETIYNIDGTKATTMQPGRLYIKGGKTILKIR